MLGHHRCQALGLTDIIEHEVELRQGYINDNLEELRIALAHKSLIFRTQLRHATGTNQRSRAWDNVRLAEKKVSMCCSLQVEGMENVLNVID